MQWNAYLSKHFDEARMSRGMQLWIAEHFEAGSNLMNLDLGLRCERIV